MEVRSCSQPLLAFESSSSALFSSELRDFIEACLRIDPSLRPSVKLLLRHSFIMTDKEEGAELLSDDHSVPALKHLLEKVGAKLLVKEKERKEQQLQKEKETGKEGNGRQKGKGKGKGKGNRGLINKTLDKCQSLGFDAIDLFILYLVKPMKVKGSSAKSKTETELKSPGSI